MYNKKAQAALEFLMTYGWAILIVLVVLAGLFSIGVFNPKVPPVCLLTAPFNCGDIVINAVAGGDNALVTATAVSTATVAFSGSCTAAPVTLDQSNNFKATVALTCIGVTAGQRATGTITGTYTLQGSSLGHTVTGTYSATVE